MTPLIHHSGATPPTSPRRRSGREAPQALTAAFRRYVERIQSAPVPAPRADLHAALRLAAEVSGRAVVVADPAVVAAHAPAIRQLARAVRQAGPRAVAQPALLARAIVVARTLAAGAASAPASAEAPARRVLAGASR